MTAATHKLALDMQPPTAALAALAAVAERFGWVYQDTFAADAEHPFEVVWREAGADVAVHFVQDDLAGQCYLALQGTPDALQAAEASLRAALPLLSLDEVLRRDRRDRAAPNLAALPGLLAVLGPADYDATVMHALADLLEAADSNVRLRTVVAMACLGWPELRPLTNAVAAADAEDFVRWRAEDLLLAWDRLKAPSPPPAPHP